MKMTNMINYLLFTTIADTAEEINKQSFDTLSLIALLLSIASLVLSAIVSIISIIHNRSIHYSTIISNNRSEWLIRLKQNVSNFISVALSEQDGDLKHQSLLALRAIILADLNILVVKDKKIDKACVKKNKIFLTNGNPLELEIKNELDNVVRCSSNKKQAQSVIESRLISIKILNILFNLLYIAEWEKTKIAGLSNLFYRNRIKKKLKNSLKNAIIKIEEINSSAA